MKSEQVMAMVQSGEREFVQLDIEGCFINEDLSNLLFENCFFEADFTGANLSKAVFKECNLKMCIFSYCNLENAIFDSNSLESANFEFVQYNDLIFKNNSAYGGEFTKAILEYERYPNYPGFHIIRVKAGWFDVILIDKSKMIMVTSSSYLGNNAPYELLKSLNEICEEKSENKSITKWFCWDEEPGAYIWKLMWDNDKIKITVYSAKRDSYKIGSENRKSLEKEEIVNTEIEIEGEFWGFIKEVARSFKRIGTVKKGKHYKKEWGSFPENELEKLKSFILTIAHTK